MSASIQQRAQLFSGPSTPEPEQAFLARRKREREEQETAKMAARDQEDQETSSYAEEAVQKLALPGGGSCPLRSALPLRHHE